MVFNSSLLDSNLHISKIIHHPRIMPNTVIILEILSWCLGIIFSGRDGVKGKEYNFR